MYAGALISAAAIVLLIWRRPGAGPAATRRCSWRWPASTAYAIAILSYTDNRSSTYLFLYVALPLLIAATLWLALILAPASALPVRLRLRRAWPRRSRSRCCCWPARGRAIGTHFNRTALAHFYPGGGLRAALHRLWHPPAIDPRAPVGIRLLDRYVPGHR